ncbi:MAG: hypothetical protein ABF679_12805 [Lentilactobacillus diolivorans]
MHFLKGVFDLNTSRLLLYLFHALKKKENDPSVLVSELVNYSVINDRASGSKGC